MYQDLQPVAPANADARPGPRIETVLAWAAFTPVLAAWPFVSALPLVDLFAGAQSLGWVVMNVFLLATGFYAALGLWIGDRLLRPRPLVAPTPDSAEADLKRAAWRRRRGVWLGAYASVWTSIYMGVAVLA